MVLGVCGGVGGDVDAVGLGLAVFITGRSKGSHHRWWYWRSHPSLFWGTLYPGLMAKNTFLQKRNIQYFFIGDGKIYQIFVTHLGTCFQLLMI